MNWTHRRRIGAAVALAALAACSTPADHLHTLLPAARSAAGPAPAAATHWLAVQVAVPDALDRDAWLLRGPGQQVELLEHQRWPQPLSAELAQALARRLDPALGDPGWVALSADAAPAATLRVQVRWLAFDAWSLPAPGVHDAWVWTIECGGRKPGPRAPLASGRGDYASPSAPAGDDAFDRIAAEHARALDQAAAAIAAAWRAQDLVDNRACAE